MILDPRLIPWGEVAPGLCVSLFLALAGFFSGQREGRWRNWGNSLLFLSPVIGWTLMLWKLEGALPGLPPHDAPLWVWYACLIGSAGGLLAGMIRRPWLEWTLAMVLFAGMVWGIREGLMKPVGMESFPQLPTAGTLTLAASALFAGAGFLTSGEQGRHQAAEMTPGLTGLAAVAAILVLTGTATVGMLALGLCLATLPLAFALLMKAHTAARYDLQAQKTGAIEVRPRFWAPQMVALPVMACCGPLYASTRWVDALVAITGPLLAWTSVAGARIFMRRRGQCGLPEELVLIAVALIISGIPAAVVIYRLNREAAAAGIYF